MKLLKYLLIVAAFLAAIYGLGMMLSGCAATPHQGYVANRSYTPGYWYHYTWSTRTCTGYVTRRSRGGYTTSTCVAWFTHIYHGQDYVPPRYELDLVNSVHKGWLGVNASTYARYQVGSYYP